MVTEPIFDDPGEAPVFAQPVQTEKNGWLITRKHPALDLLDAGMVAMDDRGRQRHLGPSEVGTPCVRKLALHALDVPEVQHPPSWYTFVGSAVHTRAEQAVNKVAPRGHLLTEFGLTLDDPELGVDLAAIDEMSGTSDMVYVRCPDYGDDHEGNPGTHVEIDDWKVVGDTTLRKAKAGNVDEKYLVQANIYGLGLERTLGLVPERIAIIFLPRNAERRNAVVCSRPYDRQIALDALERLARIRRLARSKGLALTLAKAKTAHDFCPDCPYMNAKVEVDGVEVIACRGHEVERTLRP